MSTPTTPPPRLALLALDLTGGDPEAVEALLTRLAQVTRYAIEPSGVAVGAAQHLLIPEMTASEFFAALASLKAPDDR